MNERIAAKLEFDVIKILLAKKAVSSAGKELAMEIMPKKRKKDVKLLLDETKEAETIYLSAENLPISGFPEISGVRARLRAKSMLLPGELLNVMRLMKAAKRAKTGIKPDEAKNISILPAAAEGLFYDDSLIKRIDESVESEERLSDSASAELRNIRRRIVSENEGIREKLLSLIRNKDMGKYLQDAIVTMRAGRFVVPVKSEYRSAVKGLVHGESASGATLFIEPLGVVEANNKLKELDIAEKKETERVLLELSELLRPYEEDFEYDEKILAYLDLVFAKAALGADMKGCAPKISEDGRIYISHGRHPLIDEKKVVPITLDLSKEDGNMIITGPNTGGKTVTLKLLGLFSMMAQSGLFIPAREGSELPLYESIFADIGDEQSIEQSLSTFSGHMKNIISIIKHSDKNSLILLDELCAGTDPEEGAALAMSILEKLSESGARIFATTHYSEIKSFALKTPGFINASMEFDVSTLRPTYKLIVGVSGTSNAFLISRSLGLPDEIISGAKEHMDDERLKYDYLIKEADKARRKARRQLDAARDMKKQASELSEKTKAQEEELTSKRNELIKNAKEQAYDIVLKTQEEMEQIISELKKLRKNASEADFTRAVESARRKVSAKKDTAYKAVKEKKKPIKKVDPKTIKPGDLVKIPSLEVSGSVLKAPDQKGMVAVQAGIMKLNVHYSELEKNNETSRTVYQKSSPSRVSLERKPISMSLNVIGKTVEEALTLVDKYLDDVYVAGLNEVTIIHGVGTGALKSAIRDYLNGHPHVKSYRAGRFGEGEQGVTVVSIRR